MNKALSALKFTLYTAFAGVLLVAVAGVIKFNWLDVPYVGSALTYENDQGERVYAQLKADGQLKVSGDIGSRLLKPTASASGERYSSADGQFVFWRKGQAVIIEQHGRVRFTGLQTDPEPRVIDSPASGRAPE